MITFVVVSSLTDSRLAKTVDILRG